MEVLNDSTLPVLASDLLALRGAGLAAAETWALLCQAAQALQDLFLSNGGVVGGGSRAGPVVTPHTLELTSRGRVTLQIAPPETARAYLPPEYRPGRLYSDTDSEKMWMYSLGRALLDTTPRVAALTGSVSVSPTSALQSVLAAMTEPDPQRRASLMNLLDVISEYCRTRMLTKPFTLIVIDMYREVVRSAQYAARMRTTCQPNRQPQLCSPYHYYYYYNHNQSGNEQQCENNKQSMPATSLHYSKHQMKANLFKYQSQNSRSHPNLTSLLPSESHISNEKKPQFQSQINIESNNSDSATMGSQVNHIRIHSQPIYSQCSNGLMKNQSSRNLAVWNENSGNEIDGKTVLVHNSNSSVSSDPIYAFPVKPFLSSQDVRVNRLTAKRSQKILKKNDVYAQPSKTRNIRGVVPSGTGSQPNMNSITNNIIIDTRAPLPLSSPDHNAIYYDICPQDVHGQVDQLHRQYSHSQLPIVPTLNCNEDTNAVSNLQSNIKRSQQNLQSSMVVDNVFKTTPSNEPIANKVYQPYDTTNGLQAPPKPPRIGIRNGPRARRGKPVQRASSRLYRAITGPIRCLNKTQCVGPEFVVRASQPPKLLKIGDTKGGNNNTARIVVILLSGQRIDVVCNPHKITAGELFQAIILAEGLDDNFTLGLAALLAGDFAMLPPETKLSKVSPPGWLTTDKCKGPLCLPTSFMLYLRQRFFLPSLRGIRSWISKHLLYLQIRRCILEQQLICSLSQLINLTGLALQAEFGNYSIDEHARGNYFLLEHYIPEILILSSDYQHPQMLLNANELRAQLHSAHRNRRGLDTNTAEELFITHAQELEDYGLHLYIATTDTKELEKTIRRLKKYRLKDLLTRDDTVDSINISNPINDPCQFNSSNNCHSDIYNKIHPTISRETYSNIESKENVYAIPKNPTAIVNDVERKNLISCNSKSTSSKKSETNIWFGIHGQGIKLFERTGEPRQVTQLVKLQWQDIKTLSYSKNCLIIYTKYNGKRAKLKLNMEHKKSYYAFKLTSLHHQFFLKLRSELTSLQGLTRDFGIPLNPKLDSSLIQKCKINKSKNTIFNEKNTEQVKINEKYPTSLEDYQNKENENPIMMDKVATDSYATVNNDDESICYTPEDDALYAQVNARLEPEGASRDTEDESERAQTDTNNLLSSKSQYSNTRSNKNWPSHKNTDISDPTITYDVPKLMSSNNGYDELNENIKHPEELYAAINKTLTSSNQVENHISTDNQIWKVKYKEIPSKVLTKIKTSSLPNYVTSRQSTDFRTPSLPRRLGVKMGTRAIYSTTHTSKDFSLTDDIELLSLRSETASSVQSVSAQSSESPMPEAYVLNADIRADEETFRISNDDTMSASLMARLEELSFAEERILRTIKLERGHGGSIGLQVTEGNDGGVYVQAISVGGSADMTGSVSKGDKIVAINGSSLLNLRYQDALNMLQSSSCQVVELVLSQITSNRHITTQSLRNNRIKCIDDRSSLSTNNSRLTSNWLSDKILDVPVRDDINLEPSNTHYMQDIYETDVMMSPNNLNSATNVIKNTLPPVPLRRKKPKSMNSLLPSTIIKKSSDYMDSSNNFNKNYSIISNIIADKLLKKPMENNKNTSIISEKSETLHAPHLTTKITSISSDKLVRCEIDQQKKMIENTIKNKNINTSDEILPDNSACSAINKKTELINDPMINNCDISVKYVESTLKINNRPQIMKSSIINNQIGLDRNFICAITSSSDSVSDNYKIINNNNNNNNNNNKSNNNDNKISEVYISSSRADQASRNDITTTECKGKGKVKKCVVKRCIPMYSIIENHNDSLGVNKQDKIDVSKIINNSDKKSKLSKYSIDQSSKKQSCIDNCLHLVSYCNINSLGSPANLTIRPVTPCLKSANGFSQRSNEKKFVKFNGVNLKNSSNTKKLKRKAPSVPKSQNCKIYMKNKINSQQTLKDMKKCTTQNQTVQLQVTDNNNSTKLQKGEQTLVSAVAGGGGPPITYNHRMKNNEITEELQQETNIKLTPISVKSKISTQDITKYFNYSYKENQSEYEVNKSCDIEDETMGSNFSRHHGKGLTGRRTQSSGNLCDPQGKLNDVSKMFVPCSTSSEQRYNMTGSLPNNLDNDKQSHDMDDLLDNNNIISDTIDGDLGGTMNHTKSYHQVKYYDRSTLGAQLVKHHSHDSLKGDPWKSQQNSEMDPTRCHHGNFNSSTHPQVPTYEDVFTLRNKNRNNPYHGEIDGIAQGSKTLPIRRIDPKWCDPISIRAIHQKNLIDTVDGHRPDCQLVARQRERLANNNPKQLIAGEHHNQDQGYASERSPEDEHPPLLSDQSVLDVNPVGNTFRIVLQKSSRGLGLSVSGGGMSGPVRVKRLFPQQPAALSNQLKPGDILLAANDIPLSGLTNYEALEVLRTTSNTVELLVCRQAGETSITPPGDPPTPPARRKLPSSTSRVLNPVPPLHIEPCGEFDIEMTKVGGSLGFTLRKVDSSALGHYVRALVREPALSDGRIQPGDKIVAVDDALLSPMSHEEAVSLLRQCGPKVKLRLYRDLAQTPVSALSPTEPDHPLRPPHTSLRQEAVDMLCDLAVRKLSPTTSNESGSQSNSGIPATSPRRLRKPLSRTSTADDNKKESAEDSIKLLTEAKANTLNSVSCLTDTTELQSPPPDVCEATKPSRPKFLDLSTSNEKIKAPTDLTSDLQLQEYEEPIINNTIATTTEKANVQVYDYQSHSINLTVDNIDDCNLSSEPVSMPPLNISSYTTGGAALSYKNPVYQSAKQSSNRHQDEVLMNCTRGQAASYSSDHDIPGKIASGKNPIGTKGLLKWKGVMFAPDVNTNGKIQFHPLANEGFNDKMAQNQQLFGHDCEVFMVELTRGWNSRLGFSLQSRENTTVISMVYPDSVAARDGRLKQGDVLIMVNDENVENLPTNDIIDLLRRIRGSIGITVARKKIQLTDT